MDTGRELTIHSPIARELAERLAREYGKSTDEIVEAALSAYSAQFDLPKPKLTLEQRRAAMDQLLRQIEKTNREHPVSWTSDHSDMYDENGLPK